MNQMKTKNIQIFLFSSLGIAGVAVILVALNIIASYFHVRADLTEDKIYTLSDGSKHILDKLKSPVYLRFYYSKSNSAMPMNFKTYAQRVEDLLKEYHITSPGNIRIEKFDPQPDSDAEDAAALDGIEGQQLQNGEKMYLGIAVSQLDQSVAIPFLNPQNESNLEYDISRLIYRVANPQELTIGIMSSMPVMGSAQMGMRMPPSQMQPAWVFVSELKKNHAVEEVAMTAEEIPESIDVLILIHPRDLAPRALYAIDQFILSGKKVIAFVDPACIMQSQSSPDMMRQSSPSSTLTKLFDKWGVEFDTGKVIADMSYTTQLGGQGGVAQTSASVLSLDKQAMNATDIVATSLDRVIMAYAGVFQGEPAEGLKKTVIMKSSKQAQLIDTFKAQMPVESLHKDFKAEDKEFALAIRLVGKFHTAFPDGQPAAPKKDAADEANESDLKRESLSESAQDTAVILIGDVDMIADQFWVQKVPFFGQNLYQVFSDNNNLLQNAVEQLSGDSSLISIRSRGIINRPFLIVRDMQMEAEKKYKQEIGTLEEELAEAQRKISELQNTKKDQSQQYILSPEQARELEKFKEKQAETRIKLKDLRKQLRRDIDALEMRLKFYNIALMPLLVIISGIVVGIRRKKKH